MFSAMSFTCTQNIFSYCFIICVAVLYIIIAFSILGFIALLLVIILCVYFRFVFHTQFHVDCCYFSGVKIVIFLIQCNCRNHKKNKLAATHFYCWLLSVFQVLINPPGRAGIAMPPAG